MCGRITLKATEEEIRERFHVRTNSFKHIPRYNIAPEQETPIILNTNSKEAVLGEWGFRMPWQKELSKRLINARSETVTEKPTFKKAFHEHRCLVISDGFYEWKITIEKTKQPYRIALKNDTLFAFAGLWKEHENKPTFIILTTKANAIVKPIHSRMPIMLEPHEEQIWLDNESTEEELIKIFNPYPGKKMESYQVSMKVNNPSVESPELINRIAVQ